MLQNPDFLLISSAYQPNSFTPKENNIITVDEIRGINDFIRFSSSYNGWRIVLIDGIESLNFNASNALLKVLEEPGDKVLIFLISSNIRSIIPTIRSRCKVIKITPLLFENFHKILMDYAQDNTCGGIIQKLYKITNGNVSMSLEILKLADRIENIENLLHSNCSHNDYNKVLELVNSGHIKGVANILLNSTLDKIRLGAFGDQKLMNDSIELYESIKDLTKNISTLNLDKKAIVTTTYGFIN